MKKHTNADDNELTDAALHGILGGSGGYAAAVASVQASAAALAAHHSTGGDTHSVTPSVSHAPTTGHDQAIHSHATPVVSTPTTPTTPTTASTSGHVTSSHVATTASTTAPSHGPTHTAANSVSSHAAAHAPITSHPVSHAQIASHPASTPSVVSTPSAHNSNAFHTHHNYTSTPSGANDHPSLGEALDAAHDRFHDALDQAHEGFDHIADGAAQIAVATVELNPVVAGLHILHDLRHPKQS